MATFSPALSITRSTEPDLIHSKQVQRFCSFADNGVMELVANTESLYSVIEPRICVRAPYFALEHLHADAASGILSAQVLPQTPSLFELGPIVSAEAGRHLAILGLCALAYAAPNNHRHYYLAHRAAFQRRSEKVGDFRCKIKMTALGEWKGPREAKANATAWWNNDTLVTLKVDYKVLPEATFDRIFRKHKQDQIVPPRRGAYSQFPEMSDWRYSQNEVSARMDQVIPEWCSGHFHFFPALPVAVIMGCLTKLVEGYLARNDFLDAGKKFAIETGLVEADDLAFAGTTVLFEGTLLEHHAERLRFVCRAYSKSGQTFGKLDVVARLLKGVEKP